MKGVITNYGMTVSDGLIVITLPDIVNGIDVQRIMYIRNLTTGQDMYKAGGAIDGIQVVNDSDIYYTGPAAILGMADTDTLLIIYEHESFYADTNYVYQKTVFRKDSDGYEGVGGATSIGGGNGTNIVYARPWSVNPWIGKKIRVMIWEGASVDVNFRYVDNNVSPVVAVDIPYKEVQYDKEYFGTNTFNVSGQARIFDIDISGFGCIQMTTSNYSGGSQLNYVVTESEGQYVKGSPFSHRKVSVSGNNATSLTTRATSLRKAIAYNTTAAVKVVKFYNKGSAPVPGTDTGATVLLFKLVIGANQQQVVTFEDGMAFIAGLAYAITGAVADNDNTSVAANDVELTILYR